MLHEVYAIALYYPRGAFLRTKRQTVSHKQVLLPGSFPLYVRGDYGTVGDNHDLFEG